MKSESRTLPDRTTNPCLGIGLYKQPNLGSNGRCSSTEVDLAISGYFIFVWILSLGSNERYTVLQRSTLPSLDTFFFDAIIRGNQIIRLFQNFSKACLCKLIQIDLFAFLAENLGRRKF